MDEGGPEGTKTEDGREADRGRGGRYWKVRIIKNYGNEKGSKGTDWLTSDLLHGALSGAKKRGVAG